MKKKPQNSQIEFRLQVPVTIWRNCYPSKWGGLIVKDALAHPAKFSSRLISTIYNHLADEGWMTEGDSVIDPFGGVGLGALDAMRHGFVWRGVELESQWAEVGRRNIELWNNRFRNMPRWESDAQLLVGDSRNLFETIKASMEMAVSSPPFGGEQSGRGIAAAATGGKAYKLIDSLKRVRKAGGAVRGMGYQNQAETKGNLATLPVTPEGLQISLSLSSPHKADSIKTQKGSGFDYSKSKGKTGKIKTKGRESIATGYGSSDGNLGSMRSLDFNVSIASPPFLQSSGGLKVSRGMDASLIKRHAAGNAASAAYGETGGQLSNLEEGDFNASISSPPFGDNAEGVMRASKFKNPRAFAERQRLKGNGASLDSKMEAMRKDDERADYGNTDGNVANESGDNFWSAARQIVEQVYTILKPGGHAVWVVKDYVKGGKRVPFCAQWRALCEAVGFETLHEHHAELIRSHGTARTLEGKEIDAAKSSKSFFRRVSERNTALGNYWKTIQQDEREERIRKAGITLWHEYNALSVEEKAARDKDGFLLHEEPTDKTILKAAREKAFEESGEKLTDWNRDVAIDYEVVYCMVKR